MNDKIQSLLQKFKELEEKIATISPTDTVQMTSLSRQRKKMEPVIIEAREWQRLKDELQSLEDLSKEKDPSMAEMANAEYGPLLEKFNAKSAKLNKLLNPPDPRSDRNAIIEIRAGAGGDEASIFVGELYRMYSHFAQNKKLDVEVYSSNPTGLGGFKEIIFGVSGPQAFGWFRFEQGVHRVQRVPVTEASGRIHTSTVTVAVLPEADEAVEINIDKKDLRIDTYRSSGAGGQHVNKTDSAIRITHIPSGLVVACQEERSQGQNRMRAMSLLQAKLQEADEEKRSRERREMTKKQIGSGDRSEKIRTYNFPQDRITDHRIAHSVYGIERFLGGDMDAMVSALTAKEEELKQSNPIT